MPQFTVKFGEKLIVPEGVELETTIVGNHLTVTIPDHVDVELIDEDFPMAKLDLEDVYLLDRCEPCCMCGR